MPSLAEALAYQNDDIPARFLDEWSIELPAARELFDDVKRFLFLCEQPDAHDSTIHGPLVIIDEMWHNFVLFTREYTDYCMSVYGHYQHHGPTTQAESLALDAEFASRPDEARRDLVERRARQREAVVRHLGVETLLRWYVDYPRIYNTEFFRTRRKHHTITALNDPGLIALADKIRGKTS